jgi:competence protein ComEA
MKGKFGFNWITSVAAALALTSSAFAAQQITENENTTNKVSHSRSYSPTDAKSKKVNVNTASKSELEALPGVGPSVADNIINARPFHSVNDLKSVSGIGDQRFQQIRPHVTVGASAERKSSSASGSPGNASSAYASGSDKPGAEAQARSHTTSNSRDLSAAGSGGVVTTDTVHSGSDKPGARAKEESRANTSSSSSSSRSSASSTRSNSAKVNINSASKEQLEALPGIGSVKAQAIIDNRPYTTPEDIMKVNGIKEGTYDKIRDQITVR